MYAVNTYKNNTVVIQSLGDKNRFGRDTVKQLSKQKIEKTQIIFNASVAEPPLFPAAPAPGG